MDAVSGGAFDVEAVNDRLALEHPSDEYYANSPLPIRIVEQRRFAIVRRFLGPVDGLTVAEVGSGYGHVLAMFRQAKLTAIDVSDIYLDRARQTLAGYDARFVKGEVDKLDLQPESFDRIICTEVLEHTVDPDAILAAIARLLRRDGIAAITVPNDPLIERVKGVLRHRPFRWLLGERIEWGGDEFHLHRWTPRQFRELLARHLEIEQVRYAPVRALPLRACFKCRR